MHHPDDIAARIRAALPGAVVAVRDTTGGGDHFEAEVVSALFAGKSPVQRHQMVYQPLQDWLSAGTLHALTLKTLTPEQATPNSGRQT